MSSDERIAEIRAKHKPECDNDVRDVDFGPVVQIGPYCADCGDEWPCEQGVLLARLDALAAERDAADKLYRMSVIQRAAVLDEGDALRARAERAEAVIADAVSVGEMQGEDFDLQPWSTLRAALAAASEGEG